MLDYQPKSKPGKPMPAPLVTPAKPKDVKTIEELYLIGLGLNQFYNANADPYPYYYEALKRDSGDYRVNTQLGILCIKNKMWKEAEKYLQTAVDRITMNYTRPKDSDAEYYLGIAQRALNNKKDAYNNFYNATWNVGWYTPAYHQLAELDCENGDYKSALDHINRSLSTDIDNQKALGLKLVILRKLGMTDEAKTLAENIINKDLLDYQPRNELYLLEKQQNQNDQAQASLKELTDIMQDKTQSYIEFSTCYANCGFYEEAIDILSRPEKKGDQFPLLYYYLGYYWSKLNNKEKAKQYFDQARNKPNTYCFPFRDEEVNILNEALVYNPKDAMAYYYLGDLYYEAQPEKAIELWERSQALDSSFYIVQRNLGLAAWKKKNYNKAVALYKKAFANYKDEPRLMYEYDIACQRAKISPKNRYEQIFKNNRLIAQKRSETFISELALLNNLGRYDEVIDIMNKFEFVESEGSTRYREVYLDAYILTSLREFNAGNYIAAVGSIEKALKLPLGRREERKTQMEYLLGTYYEKTGDTKRSKEHFINAANGIVNKTEYQYYKGLALLKTGQKEKAQEQFDALLELSNRTEEVNFFRSFESGTSGDIFKAQQRYLKGLAYMGMNRKGEAKTEFAGAIELDPGHLWAQVNLDDLNKK